MLSIMATRLCGMYRRFLCVDDYGDAVVMNVSRISHVADHDVAIVEDCIEDFACW